MLVCGIYGVIVMRQPPSKWNLHTTCKYFNIWLTITFMTWNSTSMQDCLTCNNIKINSFIAIENMCKYWIFNIFISKFQVFLAVCTTFSWDVSFFTGTHRIFNFWTVSKNNSPSHDFKIWHLVTIDKQIKNDWVINTISKLLQSAMKHCLSTPHKAALLHQLAEWDIFVGSLHTKHMHMHSFQQMQRLSIIPTSSTRRLYMTQPLGNCPIGDMHLVVI